MFKHSFSLKLPCNNMVVYTDKCALNKYLITDVILCRCLTIKINNFCCFIQLPAVCQTSNRKLHFSIYGKRGDAKVSDAVSIYATPSYGFSSIHFACSIDSYTCTCITIAGYLGSCHFKEQH